MKRAAKPINFEAMSDAWNDPIAFARELNTYYAQLRESETTNRRESVTEGAS